jgi:hypothetical protein
VAIQPGCSALVCRLRYQGLVNHWPQPSIAIVRPVIRRRIGRGRFDAAAVQPCRFFRHPACGRLASLP